MSDAVPSELMQPTAFLYRQRNWGLIWWNWPLHSPSQEQHFKTSLSEYLVLATGPQHPLPMIHRARSHFCGPVPQLPFPTSTPPSTPLMPAAFGPSVWPMHVDFLWLVDLGCPSGLFTDCVASGSVCRGRLLQPQPSQSPPHLPQHAHSFQVMGFRHCGSGKE